VLGWDSRWGQLREVTSAGSPTTSTHRLFGLDCSGFADWVFYNASGGEYILGHGGGAAAQHRYCENILWKDAQPGDLAFYPEDSHIGIVGGWDENGNILIIHCASGRNNVVITKQAGFESVATPHFYKKQP
jgi:cell wall-associated NlpC family hydrolase